MKVYVYPADPYGCGHYRLIWPAEELKRQGHDIVIMMPGHNSIIGKKNENGDTVAVTAPPDADVMILQRITHKSLAQSIPLWRAKGITVIVDIDDDLSTIHPANPAWKAMHPNSPTAFDWRVMEYAAKESSMVTVSTVALARKYAPHGRVAILHNYIPQSFLEIERRDSDILGWGGSIASHPHDFEVVGHSLAKLTEEGAHFHVVGPDQDLSYATRVTCEDCLSVSGSVDLFDWPKALSQQIGIGLAPLTDTKFNNAKSWLKPMEYAALGIPAVMSPRDEYVRLHKLGVGALCNKPKEWERTCRELVKNPGLREEMSIKGREAVLEMTIEKMAHLWWVAWSAAFSYEQGLPRVAVESV